MTHEPPDKSRIMYIERGGGLAGPGRIGRVTFSKSGRTIYYAGRSFASQNGRVYKTNYFDEETHEPRKDGQDTRYPGLVEIDEEAREAYWREIRNEPERAREVSFRSLGRHAKHSTR